MREEDRGVIRDQDVYEAACSAEVLTDYPDDTPYPSVLVLGFSASGRPLHVVCAYDSQEDTVVVVTVYEPDPGRWEDHRRRIR